MRILRLRVLVLLRMGLHLLLYVKVTKVSTSILLIMLIKKTNISVFSKTKNKYNITNQSKTSKITRQAKHMETIRFDYLNTFLTVARTHSFSVAAKELKTSQGTVSHHIAALEEYFDAELFKRTANGVEVTDAGATLKETAEKILQQAQDAKAKISSAKQNAFRNNKNCRKHHTGRTYNSQLNRRIPKATSRCKIQNKSRRQPHQPKQPTS